MIKKRCVLIPVITLIALIVINLSIPSFLSTHKSDVSTDVTYLDAERKIPIAVAINYNIFKESKLEYPLCITDKIAFQLTYSGNIQPDNKVIINIKTRSTKVYSFSIEEATDTENKKVLGDLDKGTYTIEIILKKGRGTINLDWGSVLCS